MGSFSRCLLLWVVIPTVTCILVSMVMISIFPANPKSKLSLIDEVWQEEAWWGPGEPKAEPDAVQAVKITIKDSALDDLKTRLDQTRLHSTLEGVGFEYGFNAIYMKEVIKYWRHTYNWKKQETVLNKYMHYKTSIEGIKIHFIHIKPPELKGKSRRRAVMFVHGWPGSIYEFYKIIPLLNNNASQSVDFDIICPSIPGYGFSDIPVKKGFDQLDAARIFHKLMARLGYKNFYVQAGDWGSIIIKFMAMIKPSSVIGAHLNLISVHTSKTMFKTLLGSVFPSTIPLFLKASDYQKVFPFWDKFIFFLEEMGYMHLQATKPDSIGFALNNSPVGLAAYIMEKFSTWTDKEYRSSPNGNLTTHYTMDDLLTNVMIYWFTGTITSSMRFYKEYWNSKLVQSLNGNPIEVPVGLAAFPNEIAAVPEDWVKDTFPNCIQYTDMPVGGHFPAFEQPQLLADDFLKFVQKVEEKDDYP